MVSWCRLQSNHSHPLRTSLINSKTHSLQYLLLVSSSDVIATLTSHGAKLYAHQKLAVLFFWWAHRNVPSHQGKLSKPCRIADRWLAVRSRLGHCPGRPSFGSERGRLPTFDSPAPWSIGWTARHKKKLERLEALPYLTFKDLREAQPAICQTFHCTGYTMPQLADQVEQTASVMNYQFWSANCQKKNYTEADGSWNQTEPS